nr:hypothetical protein [Ktedonosporobacter rubrisoli]
MEAEITTDDQQERANLHQTHRPVEPEVANGYDHRRAQRGSEAEAIPTSIFVSTNESREMLQTEAILARSVSKSCEKP